MEKVLGQCNVLLYRCLSHIKQEGRRGRDRMVVGFTTIYAISVYHVYVNVI